MSKGEFYTFPLVTEWLLPKVFFLVVAQGQRISSKHSMAFLVSPSLFSFTFIPGPLHYRRRNQEHLLSEHVKGFVARVTQTQKNGNNGPLHRQFIVMKNELLIGSKNGAKTTIFWIFSWDRNHQPERASVVPFASNCIPLVVVVGNILRGE